MIAHVRTADPALSIAIEGPTETSLSLAIVNRGLLDALARQPGLEVTAGLPGPTTTHVVRNMYPPRLDATAPGVRLFFYFAWEDSRIPSDWAQAFNARFDGLLVPSAHVRDVVRRSGVGIPVAVVPYGVDPSAASPADQRPTPAPTRRRFRFLHVSTGFPRKGCDVLIRAFVHEFSSRDDVALVIKTLPQYDHPTTRLVRRARWLRPRCPEIVHLDEDLDHDAMQRLYASAACLVHPARAEGFGLPIAEAMLARVPVIVSDCSGHADFCTDATAWLVPCQPQPSRSPFSVEDAEWCDPDEGALRQAMRRAVAQHDAPATRARIEQAAAHMRHFTWNRAAERTVHVLRALQAAEETPLRVGMVTTWRERCGIAEHSRQLIEAVADKAIHWTILAPHPDPTAGVDDVGEASHVEAVVRCARDAWPVDPDEAAAHIRRLGLQVVHVQTHLNTWPPAAALAFAALAAEGRRVFVTFHSVRGARPDRTVVNALSTLDRLLVHTDDDRRQLAARGLDQNVTVLPQGYPSVAPAPIGDARARLGLTGNPVIGTFGFLRPHKGVVDLIRAIARLRRRYPGIVLVAVSARYPSPDSAAYHTQCLAEIERQALGAHCRLITDFLDPHESIAALQACDVIALPYHPSIDSSSASVRVALAARRPVVTTSVPVFDEVDAAVLRVRSASPRALGAGIARLLDDEALRQRLTVHATRYLDEQAWAVVGQTYRKLLRGATLDLSAWQQPYPIAPRE